MKTIRNRRISWVNTILVGTLTLGAAAAALTHHWFGAILLLLCGAAGLVGALVARRPGSLDSTRLNWFEYSDERDRLLARNGFAAVGVAALIISVIEFVIAVILDHSLSLPLAQVVVFSAVFSIANARALERN